MNTEYCFSSNDHIKNLMDICATLHNFLKYTDQRPDPLPGSKYIDRDGCPAYDGDLIDRITQAFDFTQCLLSQIMDMSAALNSYYEDTREILEKMKNKADNE